MVILGYFVKINITNITALVNTKMYAKLKGFDSIAMLDTRDPIRI